MKPFNTIKSVCDLIGVIKKQHKNIVWLFVVGAISKSSISYVNIYYSAKILNLVIGGDYDACVSKVAIMLITNLILGMISCACEQAMTGISWVADDTLKQQTINKAYLMEYEELEKTETLEAIRRADEGCIGSGGIEEQLLSISRFLQNAVSLLYAIAFVISLCLSVHKGEPNFWNSYGSILVLALIYLIYCYCCSKLVKKSNMKANEVRRKNEHLNSVASYFYHNFINNSNGKDIRLYQMQDYCISYCTKFLKKELKIYLDWGKSDGKYLGVIALFTQVVSGLIYIFITAKAIYGAIDYGDVIMYAGAINSLVQAIQELVKEYMEIAYRMEYLKLYEKFIHRPNMHYDGVLPIEKRDDACYELEFQDVSFSYPQTETKILDHVSLKFKLGEKMAIVGRNGAGKSTLIKLLCRLYEPTEGKILLNGIDIGLYDYKEYVKIFSVVFQDYKIFSYPVGENISGGEEFDETLSWEVLSKVGLKERVQSMEQGLNTQLYRNNGDGVEFSGGEAQKLAIARALYKNAPFVILDEPAAALDPYSEAEIYENFNSLIQGKTAIYISHRMSSCRFCDEIVVLDGGKIAERGTHEKLIHLGGIYAALYQSQAQYYSE